MQEVTTTSFAFPSASRDTLTEILREGAQQMLSAAIEAEVAEWIAAHRHLTDGRGHRQVVRNGFLPEREITTGIGPVKIRQPRVHDRRQGLEREAFSSKILPPYLRKTTWYWLADLCVEHNLPFVLGHPQSMHTIVRSNNPPNDSMKNRRIVLATPAHS
jgi:Transposase, Mutator family